MKSAKENIKTLRIPKSFKCPNCAKRVYLSTEERINLADCVISNGAGLWALAQCGHCGYVRRIYPTAVNGVEITPSECDKLFEEIKMWDNAHNERSGGNDA